MLEIDEIGLRLASRPNTACPYDSYTEPHARGRGYFRRALQRQVDDAFALGAQRIMSWSRASNQALRRPSEAAGLRVHQAITRVRILGWSRRWVERVS
jgi:RimJ/RimL family protein N-acetyltransferase